MERNAQQNMFPSSIELTLDESFISLNYAKVCPSGRKSLLFLLLGSLVLSMLTIKALTRTSPLISQKECT